MKKPITIIVIGIISITALYLVFSLIKSWRASPCEGIFQQTAVQLTSSLSILNQTGTISIGEQQVQELTEAAQVIAIKLKACCIMNMNNQLSAQQFLECAQLGEMGEVYTKQVNDFADNVKKVEEAKRNGNDSLLNQKLKIINSQLEELTNSVQRIIHPESTIDTSSSNNTFNLNSGNYTEVIYDEKYIRIRKDTAWGIMNKSGKILVPCSYAYLKPLTMVNRSGGSYAANDLYIVYAGPDAVSAMKSDDRTDFDQQLSGGGSNLSGLISASGKIIAPLKDVNDHSYYDGFNFSIGNKFYPRIIVSGYNYGSTMYDLNGQIIYSISEGYLEYCGYGRCTISKHTSNPDSNFYHIGIIDHNGKILTPKFIKKIGCVAWAEKLYYIGQEANETEWRVYNQNGKAVSSPVSYFDRATCADRQKTDAVNDYTFTFGYWNKEFYPVETIDTTGRILRKFQ